MAAPICGVGEGLSRWRTAPDARRRSAPNRTKHDAPERRMPQQRPRRSAVPVEVSCLFQQRNDSVHACKLHHPIDRSIAQSAGHRTKREAGANFRPEPHAPSPLVLAQPRARQLIVRERAAKDLGGNAAAEQSEVNAAASRRLDETGRIANGQHAA